MIILTWNPANLAGLTDEAWDRFARFGVPYQDEELSWSTGQRNSGVIAGDQVLLLRQGSDRRGMVAFGQAMGEIYQDEHYNDPDASANYVDIEWTEATTIDQRVHTEVLLRLVPDVAWNFLKGSGVLAPPEAAERITEIWEHPFRRRTPAQHRIGEPCTGCGSVDMWPYLWGFPPDKPERAVLGGCVLDGDEPVAQCQSCGDDAWEQGRRIRI
jgi:hypothetical protein